MQTFMVGGAVRDRLLGLPSKDTDYVVVGSSVEEMLSLGYKQVGKDFPVFLSPEGNEYALARKERSTGKGYNDFVVSTEEVTLEEDLLRRDISVNSIAFDGTNYIDPYNGIQDLKKKTLRHTSEAFKEDPLRVLRLARFRARFGIEWKIAPETKLLVDTMTDSLKFLQPDRVWKEVEAVMSAPNSWLFFTTLDELGVLQAVFPNIYDMKNYREGSVWHQEPNVFEHTMTMLKLADKESILIKLMILYHDICKPLCRRLYGNGTGHDSAELAKPLIDIKMPSKYLEYVLFHIEYHQRIFKAYEDMSAKKIYKMIKAFRKRKDLLDAVLLVSTYDKQGSISLISRPTIDFSSFILAFEYINRYSPVFWIAAQDNQPSGDEIKQHIQKEGIAIIKSTIIADAQRNI